MTRILVVETDGLNDQQRGGRTGRCEWCVGFIRRDCTIMEKCVKTGLARPGGWHKERQTKERAK